MARQACQFLIEILEAQAEAERLGVVEEQIAHLLDLRGRCGLSESEAIHSDIIVGATGITKVDLYNA